MTNTALTKAIEQIKQNRVIEIRPYIYLEAMNDAIQLLTDLLPYEREIIESAYSDGVNDEAFGRLLGSVADNSQDYFTKTFKQND